MKKISVLSLLAIVLSINVNAINIMPDNLLYGFDNALDQFEIVLSLSSFSKTQKSLAIAIERLQEATEMIKSNKLFESLNALELSQKTFNEIKSFLKEKKFNDEEKEEIEKLLREYYRNLLDFKAEVKDDEITYEKFGLDSIEKLENDLKEIFLADIKSNLKIEVEVYERERIADVEIEANGEKIEFRLSKIDIESIINEISKKVNLKEEDISKHMEIDFNDINEVRKEAEKIIIKASGEINEANYKAKKRARLGKDVLAQKAIVEEAISKLNKAKEHFAEERFKYARDLAIESEKIAEKANDLKFVKEIENKINTFSNNFGDKDATKESTIEKN